MKNQFEFLKDKCIKINYGECQAVMRMLLEWETSDFLVGMELPEHNMPDPSDIILYPKNKVTSISPDPVNIDMLIHFVEQMKTTCGKDDPATIDRVLKRLTIASDRTKAKEEANRPPQKFTVRKRKFTVNSKNTKDERTLLHSYRRITESSPSNDFNSHTTD